MLLQRRSCSYGKCYIEAYGSTNKGTHQSANSCSYRSSECLRQRSKFPLSIQEPQELSLVQYPKLELVPENEMVQQTGQQRHFGSHQGLRILQEIVPRSWRTPGLCLLSRTNTIPCPFQFLLHPVTDFISPIFSTLLIFKPVSIHSCNSIIHIILFRHHLFYCSCFGTNLTFDGSSLVESAPLHDSQWVREGSFSVVSNYGPLSAPCKFKNVRRINGKNRQNCVSFSTLQDRDVDRIPLLYQ